MLTIRCTTPNANKLHHTSCISIVTGKQRFIVADNIGFGEYDWDILKSWDREKLSDWGLEVPYFPEIENKEKEIDELDTKFECPNCGYKW